MALPRIRTLRESYSEIKKADPDSAVSRTYIRRLVTSGAVISVKAGNKYLINFGSLEEYLNNPNRLELDRAREYEAARNKIRAVAER